MDTTEYLNVIFPEIPKKTVIECRAIRTNNGQKEINLGRFPKKDFIKNWVEHRSDWNVYMGMALRSETGGGKKKNCPWVMCLWADCDFEERHRNGGKPKAFYDRKIEEFPLKPYVVDSGGGFYLVWPLKEPFEIKAKDDVGKIELYLKTLAKHFEADASAAELARILRVVGSYNCKYDDKPMVKVVAEGAAVDLEDFGFLELEEVVDFGLFKEIKANDSGEVKEAAYTNVNGSQDNGIERVLECEFIKHCDRERKTLPEPLWYAMVSNLAPFGEEGIKKILELSEGYPGYSKEETDAKIQHWIDTGTGPHTCEFIRSRGFQADPCPGDCGVKSPAGLGGKSLEIELEDPKKEAEDNVARYMNLVILPIRRLSELDLPKKEIIIRPWLTEQAFVSSAGWRGVGKTYFWLSLSIAIAKAKRFGPWEIEKNVKTLYVDSELPWDVFTQRWRELDRIIEGDENENLVAYSDYYRNHLGLERGDFTTSWWLRGIHKWCVDNSVKVCILDNVSTLFPGFNENSKESWDPINQGILQMRFDGITVVTLCHTSKTSRIGARGHSGQEDNADLSLSLVPPKEWIPSQGAKFQAVFSKTRLINPEDAGNLGPWEFELTDSGWVYNTESTMVAKIKDLLENTNYSQTKIAEIVGCDRSHVSHTKKRMDQEIGLTV